MDLLHLAGSLPFLDEIYEQWRADPKSVDESWRALFEGRPRPTNGQAARPLPSSDLRAGRVYTLVNSYRARGHLEAELDPLEHIHREPHPDLDFKSYGFSDADLDRVMPSGGLYGIEAASLGEILRRLRATYCGPVGVEM